MNLPSYNIRQLLEAGVHFGHQTHRWNPLMDEYIYGSRNGIHILDLTQTLTMLDTALSEIHKLVAKGGSILFVGTKRQATVYCRGCIKVRSVLYKLQMAWRDVDKLEYSIKPILRLKDWRHLTVSSPFSQKRRD